MRDIKYRAWIKPHVDYVGGKMWQVVGMTWREYVDDGEPENPVHNRVFDIDIQDIEEFDKGWSSKTAWQHLEPEDFELIEFTGLKDKNGKEIYEGDIVKGDWDVVDGIYVSAVDFRGSNFSIEKTGLPLSYGSAVKECEVIGNIYEDPDLLKV